MLGLRELQSRFFDSIARSPGTGPSNFDPMLVNCVEGRGELGGEARINIYAEMYFARLVDVLESDFSRVAALLGCERFHEVVSQYLTCYPSRHPSLRHLGRFFPRFLANCALTVDLPFLGDLAALEWGRVEAFDALDAEPLRIEHLQNLSSEQWPMLKFRLIPALQIIQCEWPVYEIWNMAETEENAAMIASVRPEPTTLRIWRNDFSVYHTKIDVIEQTALNCFLSDQPFASVCAALEEVAPNGDATAAIGGLLLRWIEDGILSCFSDQ
jgi:hypothetical protein